MSFVSKARETKNLDDLFIGAPDLAVEVISPSETSGMIRAKLRNYFAYGTRTVWLVYSDIPGVEVFTSFENANIFGLDNAISGGDVLPGFTLSVRDIFAVLNIE